jgi:cytochrome c-type protein NapC
MGVMDRVKALIGYLLKPAVGWSVLSLGGLGIVIGIVSVVGFEISMAATNTETFCLSCHNHDIPNKALQMTSHYNSRTGVRPTCSDCHVPHAFVPKMIRKIQASTEVWSHIKGTIDTPEKYTAHAQHMKDKEIARMRASDSEPCRRCHDVERMDFSLQSAKAQQYHQAIEHQNKTCIDCHQGIAHDYDQAKKLTEAP